MTVEYEFDYDRRAWDEMIRETTGATIPQVYSSMAAVIRQFLKAGGGGLIPRRTGELRRSYLASQRPSRSLSRRVIEVRNKALPRKLAGTKRQTGRTRAQNVALAGRAAGRYAGILENARTIRGNRNEHYHAGRRAVSRYWDQLLQQTVPEAERKAQLAAKRVEAKQRARFR